ncbi:MAG TPA: type II secretion system protein [Gemmatimonadaceae bacterium]|nr:type II secretion system protein [Gemmatimonadaceae bacterium]
MRAFRKGFTLIEILVVMVVLAILATIAIARFSNMKEESFVASMKADLRNLAIYQMNYYIDSKGFYFSGDGVAQGFVATPGVTVASTAEPGPPASWSATATHSKTSRACTMTTTGANWDIACP